MARLVESLAKVPPAEAGAAAFTRPTEGALREEGADGGPNPPRSVEGTVVARHAVMPPPYPEPYRWGLGEPRQAVQVQTSAAEGSV
jgi:hypothetical protein